MGKLKMVRIDYRMIHGQIVAKWIKFRPVERLVLVDNELVNDEFMSDIYRMAVPDYKVDIVKVEDAQKEVDKNDDSIMLIFKDVNSAFQAFKQGLKFPELNVGAIQSNANRKSVAQGVSLSNDEYEKLIEIKNAGVNVFLQPIPESDATSLKLIEKKMK